MEIQATIPSLVDHPRYRLRDELGRGSFGVVYRAFDNERSRDVALKLLTDVHPRSLVDLRSELRARADVHHPSLLQIYGLELEGERAFLTMELVENAVSFVDYVRGGEAIPTAITPELVTRLARSTHDLLSALYRLHVAGFVHRDVKPQNVLVNARTGELRLSDFGLAAPWASLAGKASWGYLYGTPAYLAPELWWGAAATPAADLYSVGAMLLETLTGECPGAPATDPVRIPGWIRDALGGLISGLLAREPKERLDVAAACRELRALAPALELPPLTPAITPSFVGRTAERERVLAVLSRPTAAVTWIQGPSGIGKTSFVEHVLSSWTCGDERVVLRGRCHPQEHVRFRAWDEIAAQLARHCGRERIERELGPDEAAALHMLFPIFDSEPTGGPSPTLAATPSADQRRIAVGAFRALLDSVSAARRLVVWIDDLQWANDDSLELLSELLERGAGNTVWILSHRPGDDSGEPPFRARIRSAAASIDEIDLPLGALDRADVGRLLRDLGVGETQADAGTMDLLAVLPMFAPELAATSIGAEPARRLEALVARRTAGLDSRRLRLLDTVAACPRPIPWTLLADAVEQPSELFDDFLALRQAGLLRRSEEGAGARVWTYHDLIREARLASMPPSLAGEIHARLIEAYDEHAPDEHEVLAHHLERAGDGPRAAKSLASAATQALEQLAFASAASHLDRAFALDPASARSWQLQMRRAECDASRGLARAAGERFEQAARLREAIEGPSATLELRSRAARELICCGQIGSGYEILRQLMDRLGTRLPRNHVGTLAWSAALRGRLVLREPGRGEGIPPGDARAHLDALWTGCTSLSHINHALADVFLLRHLTLALRVGDPSHLAKALAFEAVAEATIGGAFLLRRSDELMRRAEAICAARDDDYDWAWFWTSKTARAAFDSDWKATVECSLRAESYFDRRRHGVAWERSVARIYRAIALAMIGDAPALRAVVTSTAADARDRDDPVALNGVTSGHPAILRLYDDAPSAPASSAGTHGGLQRGARWPEVAFTSPDYYEMIADAERLLYEGRDGEAVSRVARDWEALGQSALLRLRFVGIDAHYLRARCALRAAGQRGVDARHRRRMIAVATDDMRRVSRSGEVLAEPYARAIAAGLAALAEDPRAAIEAYEQAASAFMARAMRAHAAAATRASALLRRDPSAIARAEAQLADLGAASPARLAGVLVPISGVRGG